jgi:transcription antitermination factor NusG
MSEPYWTACYTQPGQEHKARSGIEAAGFGAFVPTFVRKGMFRGRLQTVERPLISRYIFVSIDESNDEHIGEIHRELIDGVSHLVGHVLSQDVHRLMLAHASGEFDKEEQPRNAAGRFGKIAEPGKQKKRRSRPRRGSKSAKSQRKKRARERKASKLFPQYANQVAA